jgi:hypothetical protein
VADVAIADSAHCSPAPRQAQQSIIEQGFNLTMLATQPAGFWRSPPKLTNFNLTMLVTQPSFLRAQKTQSALLLCRLEVGDFVVMRPLQIFPSTGKFSKGFCYVPKISYRAV